VEYVRIAYLNPIHRGRSESGNGRIRGLDKLRMNQQNMSEG
jgi:hypothetical protein